MQQDFFYIDNRMNINWGMINNIQYADNAVMFSDIAGNLQKTCLIIERNW